MFDSLKFDDNQTNKVSRLEVYANGHLFKLFEGNYKLKNLKNKIAIGCGVGLTNQDLSHCEAFKDRIIRLTDVGDEMNCSMLVDAEQTYL